MTVAPGTNQNTPRECDRDPELEELLTVEDVATLLRVSKSWVYEHAITRDIAIRTPAAHEGRPVCPIRGARRSRLHPEEMPSNAIRFPGAAKLTCGQTTKSQREERVSLEWLDRNVSMAPVVFWKRERGG
jgi:hypothetical protein